ncbi:P-loop containing nucleoside triphosphate hydrolase protein [Blyttiomyces helicus]|uniref:P-loop containing nucleoside triphosphate hydrolase protein n=1 Tax=Blyttiomyces helicus TaxID=388810 RepID=A0A4P9WDZ2_9FUNG|nr:P-loop containing nucleoside triphosphate hydrolase protein [Blyttiomyces helicus]|eukprot:RKO90929.1 P-loop containing nucleoside triphosphate hydrolase protein [Blyttiomyces helicus]
MPNYDTATLAGPKNVVVIGSAGCGKSALVQRAVANTFGQEYLQTFGAEFCVKTATDSKKGSLNIWCCGGHERYRALLEQFFVNAHVCTPSFLELPFWYNEYKRYGNSGIENSPDATAILVGTKVRAGTKKAREWGMEFKAVSAKTGMNVIELFDRLFQEAA